MLFSEIQVLHLIPVVLATTVMNVISRLFDMTPLASLQVILLTNKHNTSANI